MKRTRKRKSMADIKELKEMLESVSKALGDKIDNLTKILDEKVNKIAELENKINLLEEKAIYNDKRYELLERKLDDMEQYGRRTSLRINGIKYNGKESAEESLKKVRGSCQTGD